MRELCQKHLSLYTFLDSIPHSSFANTKKLDVTLHPVMTCNGTIVLHIFFEQRSFALKLTSDCKFTIIDVAYALITTTSVSSESISTGVV